MPTKINATILADSICNGHRITTMKLTYPRFIHSEMCRHRMHSRNTASSRAIPIQKMIEAVKNDPVMPIAWQKNHSGMQGTEYLTSGVGDLEDNWLRARDVAVERAEEFVARGTTKQIINRLLEPWMWCVEIVTATEWENFFHLRCGVYEHKYGDTVFKARSIHDLCTKISARASELQDMSYDEEAQRISELDVVGKLKLNKGQAEIHMMAIAEAMWDQFNSSVPKELKSGEWHIPYGDIIAGDKIASVVDELNLDDTDFNEVKVRIATAMLAQTSYTVVGEDGKPMSYENLIDLHNSLLIRPYTNRKGVVFGPDDPIHASPAEHCAQAMHEHEFCRFIKGIDTGIPPYTQFTPEELGWCYNFRGWKSYRSMIPNENRR